VTLSAAKRVPIIVTAAIISPIIILAREAGNGIDCIFMLPRIKVIVREQKRLCVNCSLKNIYLASTLHKRDG
jgi:hypothetical protein